ncbi:phosphoesterase-domain-containing protein [Rhizodiscina lignyota]|uniref:Phosphoesterase-domain-containing protein n=1 Tax=Rhizodiscina lignyota TaxID=1504668 RepID=A0A9P4M2T7_9PEZI|nr:phosphoesterase-domain-containing protein [Rhizodiscina lignyota]
MPLLASSLLALGAFALSAEAGLSQIDHVVLFMQENRAFDHYFGTMAGIRGFKDPNRLQAPGHKPVWYQDVDSSLSNDTDSLLPWYLNYLGGDWVEATQCMSAGDNGWNDNHAALNDDLNNKWALNNTPWSWGYYKRSDLPVHFGIAEGWTIGDMYQESVIASTNPNRVSWASGSINAPGSPQTPDEGGITIDNNETPGCEGTDLNCYPLKWKTFAEYWEDAGVSWQLYQDVDNFDDNPLAWFQQFQQASNTSALGKKGMSFLGLDKFYEDAKNGNLPSISYIIGPAELSEHPPYQPKDGGWLQQQIVNAVVNGKNYDKTALIISFDETGGWGDHVVPYHSPKNTPGEWIEDPYSKLGDVYTGPGFRLPFYIVSPWTRGGHVFTERSDHISQIKFVEEWLASKGKHVVTTQVPAWRRAHMSDLTKAFDFSKTDLSIPNIPKADTPSLDSKGVWNGYAVCEAAFNVTRPPVPYGKQTEATSLVTESGFKSVRGQLTEGRYLTFEASGYALGVAGSFVVAQRATSKHNSKSQRWVIHQTVDGGQGAAEVILSSAVDGRYLAKGNRLTSDKSRAQGFKIVDQGNGKGYTIQATSGQHLGISRARLCTSKTSWNVFSVTY